MVLVGTVTPNYGFNKPAQNDLMREFETWINANWDKMTNMVSAPIIATADLPQTGSYVIGSRVYHQATKSIYILVAKDVDWGWHWRPIQAGISPWVNVPANAIALSPWVVNLDPTKPFQIALGNGAYGLFMRGVIGVTSGQITQNTNYSVFKPLPLALSPRSNTEFMVGHEALSVDGFGYNAWQGARIKIGKLPSNVLRVRAEGGKDVPSPVCDRVYMDRVQYITGEA